MPTTRPPFPVDRSIPRTTLVAGYCFNAKVLLKWARHVLGDHYGDDLNDVANAMFDMSEVTKNKYNIILHPLGEELTAEALENMIITQYIEFPKGYLGYPDEKLPKVEEGAWEARVREILIKEGLSPNDFYFARRLTEFWDVIRIGDGFAYWTWGGSFLYKAALLLAIVEADW